jgi:hypothetical protein
MHDKSNVKGFYRLNVVEEKDGKSAVVGDSGWVENTITNVGYESYIVGCVGSIAGSSRPSHLAIGTGTAPATNGTALPGELSDDAGCRFAVTPSAVSSKTARFVGTLASGVITATRAIANIGLFATSAITAGSVMAGNTYTASTLQTNQSVNCTYEIRFS